MDLALAHVRLERGHQASVGKQRRENATGKVSKLIQRALRLRGQAVQRLRGPRRILDQQMFRIGQLGLDRFKPALDAIPNLAFEALLFGLPRGHDAITRGAKLGGLLGDLVKPLLQLGRQPDVAQDEARVAGKVGE